MNIIQEHTKVITKEEFADMVVKAVKEEGVSYLEATSNLVESLNIEMEYVKSLISKPLLVKLEAEATMGNLLKVKHKTKRLF